MFRKKDFDARPGGLRGFDEDELVFVGQDHRIPLQLADASRFRQAPENNSLASASSSGGRLAAYAPPREVVIYWGLNSSKRTSLCSPSSIASTRISEGSMLSCLRYSRLRKSI